MPLHLRELTAAEREAAFRDRTASEPNEYDQAIRRMQPATAYVIELNGSTVMSVRMKFVWAARRRGVKLRWAKIGTTGLAVELRP